MPAVRATIASPMLLVPVISEPRNWAGSESAPKTSLAPTKAAAVAPEKTKFYGFWLPTSKK